MFCTTKETRNELLEARKLENGLYVDTLTYKQLKEMPMDQSEDTDKVNRKMCEQLRQPQMNYQRGKKENGFKDIHATNR